MSSLITESPHLLFFHGLLGDKSDWQEVISALHHLNPRLNCHGVDLPYHGENSNLRIANFNQSREFINYQMATITNPIWLLGYSLGGRLLLDWLLNQPSLPHNLQGVILEGVNFGLENQTEINQRWDNDSQWAEKFRKAIDPIQMERLLEKEWYRQRVFDHLSSIQRQNLAKLRSHNKGEKIAQMLEATSLARQNNYLSPQWREKLCQISLQIKVIFMVGSADQKFKTIGAKTGLPVEIISHSGHNSHQENPLEFAQKITNFIFP